MPTWIRRLQYVGLVVLLGCTFATTFHLRAHPAGAVPVPGAYEIAVGTFVEDGRQVPGREFVKALEESAPGRRFESLWRVRAWYPFFLAPLWLLALALSAPPGTPTLRLPRALIGALLMLLATGIAVFEALYLRVDYASFLIGTLGSFETVGVWLFVVALLFWRRRCDRGLGAVEAGIAAQALLGFAHFATLPATMARPWVGIHAWPDILAAVLRNFPPGFWLGCLGTLLVAVPVYVRPAPRPPPHPASQG